ncbi:MAG TPA: GNAT family N-acetyltransferase [Candidatus Limnocylindrales bacterium]|nr:GNAT family N-acetyltransferase [Candidatus Limnocylindrales bacterium]
MTTPTLDADPDCARPGAAERLIAERRSFDSIPREAWDRLAALNPWATPFSSWGFHRAWWDAYGENAHDQTLVVVDPDCADLVAIAPLMHRHVVEASDAQTHTSIRHGSPVDLTPVAPSAKAVYFGASYHADYATLLADPLDLPEVAEAIVEALCAHTLPDPDHPDPWDVVDLRRLRVGDPAAEALASAIGAHEITEGWTLNLEQEDVCPVAALPSSPSIESVRPTIDDFLATLDKHDRHEIRRKVRRAESAGRVELVESTDPQADLEAFIDLHQARWNDDGLFPATRGGDQSRTFVRRLFELMAPVSTDATPSLGSVHLTFLTASGRRIGAAIHFETADSLLYYNAGLDPEARHLSPGVVLVERLARRALERGLRRLDFLRGNEAYKYEWGARDESIQRLLIRRTGA